MQASVMAALFGLAQLYCVLSLTHEPHSAAPTVRRCSQRKKAHSHIHARMDAGHVAYCTDSWARQRRLIFTMLWPLNKALLCPSRGGFRSQWKCLRWMRLAAGRRQWPKKAGCCVMTCVLSIQSPKQHPKKRGTRQQNCTRPLGMGGLQRRR